MIASITDKSKFALNLDKNPNERTMKISKLTHLIFVVSATVQNSKRCMSINVNFYSFLYFTPQLLAFVAIAVGTEITELNTAEMGGKLFCVQPGKTYCLNVVNYPR